MSISEARKLGRSQSARLNFVRVTGMSGISQTRDQPQMEGAMEIQPTPSHQMHLLNRQAQENRETQRAMLADFSQKTTKLSEMKLDVSLDNSTQKDEATRLISRFTSTIETLNQILQKV